MRLICPNCGAQYEVPTEVIPEAGRDVQCSDCSTTWFQHHPDHPPADPQPEPPSMPEDDIPEPAAQNDEDYGFDEDPGANDPEPEDLYGNDPEPEDLEEDDDEPGDETPPPAAAPSRRGIDPQVADVLRQEAERETRARQEDQRSGLETQEELGLTDTGSDAARRSEQARARMARLRGETEEPPADDPDDLLDQGSRRNLLPDIDEINSSLRPDQSDAGIVPPPVPEDAVKPAGTSGFRKGFRLAVIVAVLALLLYIFAPQLVETVPALAEPVAKYVDTINEWRVALNGFIEGLTSAGAEQGSDG